MTEKVAKLLSSTASCEAELTALCPRLDESITNQARRVRVEALVKECRDLMLIAIEKNDQLIAFAEKSNEAETQTRILESWQYDLNLKHDQCLDRARLYIDSVEEAFSDAAALQQQAKHTSSKSASMTSSKKTKEILMAKLLRDRETKRSRSSNCSTKA